MKAENTYKYPSDSFQDAEGKPASGPVTLFASLPAPDGQVFRLTYSLIQTKEVFLLPVSEETPPDPSRTRTVYSLLTVLRDGLGGCETSFIYDAAADRHTAQKLLRALRRGKVTPCTAADVVADLIE